MTIVCSLTILCAYNYNNGFLFIRFTKLLHLYTKHFLMRSQINIVSGLVQFTIIKHLKELTK